MCLLRHLLFLRGHSLNKQSIYYPYQHFMITKHKKELGCEPSKILEKPQNSSIC